MKFPGLQRFLRDYLTYSRRERRGVLVLLALIIITIGTSEVLSILHPGFDPVDREAFEREVAAFEASRIVPAASAKPASAKAGHGLANTTSAPAPPQLFPFNPNQTTAEQWRSLGLKDWQIRNLEKYLAKGGHFRTPDDLKKLYGLDSALYHSWKPYIRLPKVEPPKVAPEAQPWPVPAKEAIRLDLNRADSAALTTLRGIGPFYARQIIRYRKQLGGFHGFDQLREVWRMNDSLVEKIRPHLYLDSVQVAQVSLNTSDENALRKHPYIRYNLARAIVAYREQHGPYKRVEDVQNTDLVTPELYRKLAPYLTVQ